MAIYELYSTRNKAKYPEVYQYTEVSDKLRTQVAQILVAAIGTRSSCGYQTPSDEAYAVIFNVLKREYGESSLGGCYMGSASWLEKYLVDHTPTEEFIDVLELSCRLIDKHVRQNWANFTCNDNVSQKPDDALEELNERMKRAGFGYEYTDGVIVRIDEQYIHAEVVKPALLILQDFKGAQEEFLSAHEHYRHGNFEECITDCCKSFESLMKSICHERGWIDDREHDQLPAAKLIQKCIENELVPLYMQNQFASFRQLLESGVPTIRNKSGGHGAGKEVRNIPQGLVSYTLHLTATNIVFLGKCYHETK
ncbi:STM4504/CBY_0614 family protein [Vibrio diabolicus]|uniref:STM4504/CBY_0614 family protein n=1 Tax=Vibrio diabolicus TaxID=50719 RepID=UPI00374793CF